MYVIVQLLCVLVIEIYSSVSASLKDLTPPAKQQPLPLAMWSLLACVHAVLPQCNTGLECTMLHSDKKYS